mgnify:CR=1 FL=1
MIGDHTHICSTDAALPHRAFDGRFYRAEKIGSGNYGYVYRGIDGENDSEVALKFEPADTKYQGANHEFYHGCSYLTGMRPHSGSKQ